MPSNTQRIVGALVSAAITIAGAGLASLVPATEAEVPAEHKSVEGLLLDFTGVRNGKGKILVAVFDKEATYNAYDYNNAAAYVELDANATWQATFPKLKAGPYVVSAFHDENGNGKLDMRGQYPEEGYATSRTDDPYITPSFRKASVKPGYHKIPMHYLY